MKALTIIALAAVTLSAGLTSCKKGENDPFLSLSSRKARLAGEWTVSASSSTSSNTFGGTTTTSTSTYNGTTENSTYSSGGVSIPSTTNYTIEMIINKDGSFSRTTINSTDQEKYEETGSWTFAGKNKADEYKNKELVVFYTKKTVYTDLANTANTSSQETTSVNDGETLIIDQLKGKEIIFKSKSNSSSTSGNVSTNESSMTLTKK